MDRRRVVCSETVDGKWHFRKVYPIRASSFVKYIILMLPSKITKFVPGDDKRTSLSARVMNEFVDGLNPLLAMEGRGGIKITKSDTNFVVSWSGSISGSGGGGGEGTATNFRGQWSSLVTYAEGDVVFTHGAGNQAANQAHTYVSKLDSNLNNIPPNTLTLFEDAYWRVVSLGSWPTFVVANSNVAPVDERIVTLAPGAGEFYTSGSGDTGDGANDTTTIAGGIVDVGGKLTVTGPVKILFVDGTEITIDVTDMKDMDDNPIASELNGKVFKLRLMPFCDAGIERKIGILSTEVFD